MKKVTTLKLQRVHYMPKELASGILYVSEEFEIAGHLCACGCGIKVMTPLGATEWSFVDTPSGPSLSPSIGNWQIPCKSHYWIEQGSIEWSSEWSAEQIERGRRAEDARRRDYYESRKPKKQTVVSWLKGLLETVLAWFR